MQARIEAAPATGGSKIAVGCMMLFALPFVATGVGAMITALSSGKALGDMVPLLLFGAIFAAAGIGVVVIVLAQYKANAQQAAIRAAAPDEPWRWRADWAAGHAKDEAGDAAYGLLFFGLLWTGISSMTFFLIPQETAKGNYGVLIALLFPIIGVVILSFAIYGILRKRKFGGSVLHLGSVPFTPGRTLSATLRSRIATLPENGFNAKLTHVHRWITGSGKNRSTHEKVLWEESKVIARGSVAPSPDMVSIPVSFTLPADAPETDGLVESNRRLWRLEVTADIPGIDFAAKFEIPVYRRKGEQSASADAWPT